MSKKLVYSHIRKVSASFMDCTARLGFSQSALLVQDNLSECFGMLGCDNYSYKAKYNGFWVFSKTKIHFNFFPEWNTDFIAETFPIDNMGFRTNINTIFKTQEGKPILTANSECCCLDFEKHRPLKLTNLDFPKEDFPAPVFNDKFEKFDVDFSQDDFVYEHVVRSSQVDMSDHLNNVEYVKIASGAFPSQFLRSHEPLDLEVHYLGETKENQKIAIYKKEIHGKHYIKIQEGQRPVFEMCITFQN